MPISSDLDHKVVIIFKEKGTGNKLSYELPFRTLPNEYQRLNEEGLSVDYTYLFDKEQDFILTKKQYRGNGSLWLVIGGLNGFEEDKKLVFPELEVLVVDGNSDTLYRDTKKLNKMSKGVPVEEISKPIGVELEFNDFPREGSVKIIANLKDKNSKKSLTVDSKLFLGN